jgi:hypothetical protein
LILGVIECLAYFEHRKSAQEVVSLKSPLSIFLIAARAGAPACFDPRWPVLNFTVAYFDFNYGAPINHFV